MALSVEQQSQVDMQIAVENHRNEQQQAMETKRTRLEAIRLAKEVLIENARNKPVDSREVTASDISTFANSLVTYVNT